MLSGFSLVSNDSNRLSFSKEGDLVKVDYFSVFDKQTSETDTFVATFDKVQFQNQLLNLPNTKKLVVSNGNGDAFELSGTSGGYNITLSRKSPSNSFSITNIDFSYEKLLDSIS